MKFKKSVRVGTDSLKLLRKFLKNIDYSKVVLISGQRSDKYWGAKILKLLPKSTLHISLPPGESSKSLKTVESIHRQMLENGCDRKTLIITLGGGRISDIGGFAASTYMRGVAWAVLPTTLLSQADASIGGKTGVNLSNHKNIIGTYHQPKFVLTDIKFLSTLPRREMKSGIAEIIKMGIMLDKKLFEETQKLDLDNINNELLESIIALSVQNKLKIVSKDSQEIGPRKLLNFGHTIGHAIETISMSSRKPLLHGEAISIGMAAEANLAVLEGKCPRLLAFELEATLRNLGLPTKYRASAKVIEKLILKDKKNKDSKVLWSLPKSIGKGLYNYQADSENVKRAILRVLDYA